MIVGHRNHVDEVHLLNVDLEHMLDVACKQRHLENYLCVDQLRLVYENYEKIHVHYLKKKISLLDESVNQN